MTGRAADVPQRGQSDLHVEELELLRLLRARRKRSGNGAAA
jgi:hypothetical protein